MRQAIGGLVLGALLLLVPGGVRGADKSLVGKPAPKFSLPGLDGTPVSSAATKGKVVLLNFWDFGCPSCNQEVKHLERLHRKYSGQGLRVVGVAEVQQDAVKVKQFLQQHEATYSVVLDAEQSLGRKYGVAAHPVTVVIDRGGVVRFVHTGFLKGDEKTIEEAVKATLGGEKIASAGS